MPVGIRFCDGIHERPRLYSRPVLDDDADDDADDDTWSPLPGDEPSPLGPISPACRRAGGGEPGPLRAGVATGDLYAPIGTSMGGYGSRPGPSHPYAVSMGASTGYIDRLDVKALALDNGETRLAIARIPAAGASEALYRTVLERVCEQSGVDLTGRLWLSATHTFNESDESLCAKWVQNAYWQAFCGLEYFQHELPLHPTSLVKWRKRIGPERRKTLPAAILGYRMIRRHLKGADGDAINATLAARGFNPSARSGQALSKLLRAIRVRVFVLIPESLFSMFRRLKNAFLDRRSPTIIPIAT